MKRRKTCGQYIAEKTTANRDRQVDQTFSDLERQAIRERLAVLAPDRPVKPQVTRAEHYHSNN